MERSVIDEDRRKGKISSSGVLTKASFPRFKTSAEVEFKAIVDGPVGNSLEDSLNEANAMHNVRGKTVIVNLRIVSVDHMVREQKRGREIIDKYSK